LLIANFLPRRNTPKFLLQLSLNHTNLSRMIDATRSPNLSHQGCPHSALCPLNKVRVGRAARIKQLSAPPEVSRRLREMGFCEERRIKLLSRESNLICQVCNVRLGISAQLAASIWVELLPAEQRAA
jgi:Fe2+ transport system protein FeoA